MVLLPLFGTVEIPETACMLIEDNLQHFMDAVDTESFEDMGIQHFISCNILSHFLSSNLITPVYTVQDYLCRKSLCLIIYC